MASIVRDKRGHVIGNPETFYSKLNKISNQNFLPDFEKVKVSIHKSQELYAIWNAPLLYVEYGFPYFGEIWLTRNEEILLTEVNKRGKLTISTLAIDKNYLPEELYAARYKDYLKEVIQYLGLPTTLFLQKGKAVHLYTESENVRCPGVYMSSPVYAYGEHVLVPYDTDFTSAIIKKLMSKIQKEVSQWQD